MCQKLPLNKNALQVLSVKLAQTFEHSSGFAAGQIIIAPSTDILTLIQASRFVS